MNFLLSQTNLKGQVVIPKAFRDQLGIKPDSSVYITIQGTGIYLEPVTHIIRPADTENSYRLLLKKTSGSWSSDSWRKMSASRRIIEKKASTQRKQSW